MGETLANLRITCIELYNASDPSLGLGVISSNCEWLKSGEFDIYLLLADAEFAPIICERRGLARKPFLTGTQNGIANGALLNAIIGPVETIQAVVTGGRWAGINPGIPPRGGDLASQLNELMIENRNVTANPEIPPHYVQEGETIFHNAVGLVLGGAASVSFNSTFCVFVYNQAASSIQCPADYNARIVYRALAMKFGTDGQKIEAAAYFKAMSMPGAQAQ